MRPVLVVAREAIADLIVHLDGHLTAAGGPFDTTRTIPRPVGEVASPAEPPTRVEAGR